MHRQILYFYIEIVIISLPGRKISVRLFGLYGKSIPSNGYFITVIGDHSRCSTFRHRLRITADDRQLEDTFMMLAVCNGQQYGGGYCAAPHASMNDGLLDVVLLRPVPRLKLPGLLGSYKKGEHLSGDDTVTEKFAPYMTFFRTGSIDIEVLDGNPLITTLDGECSPQLRMHAEIAHSAARILLPPELAANANKTPVLQAMGE